MYLCILVSYGVASGVKLRWFGILVFRCFCLAPEVRSKPWLWSQYIPQRQGKCVVNFWGVAKTDVTLKKLSGSTLGIHFGDPLARFFALFIWWNAFERWDLRSFLLSKIFEFCFTEAWIIKIMYDWINFCQRILFQKYLESNPKIEKSQVWSRNP